MHLIVCEEMFYFYNFLFFEKIMSKINDKHLNERYPCRNVIVVHENISTKEKTRLSYTSQYLQSMIYCYESIQVINGIILLTNLFFDLNFISFHSMK